jgi:sulfate adenylyltransferase
MNYLPSEDRYAEATEIPKGTETWSISGTEVREKYLAKGNPLPSWFTRPEVAAGRSDAYPPRLHQGFCIWINGLNSTRNLMTAHAIASLCMEFGRSVSVLDTSDVPQILIGASSIKKDDQCTDIQFIGFVASEIVSHHGIAICINNNTPIAVSNKIKRMVGQEKIFEVFIDTPDEASEVCESTERLSKNKPDEVSETVSVDKSYGEPEPPQIVIDNSITLSNGASVILAHISKAGFLLQS